RWNSGWMWATTVDMAAHALDAVVIDAWMASIGCRGCRVGVADIRRGVVAPGDLALDRHFGCRGRPGRGRVLAAPRAVAGGEHLPAIVRHVGCAPVVRARGWRLAMGSGGVVAPRGRAGCGPRIGGLRGIADQCALRL